MRKTIPDAHKSLKNYNMSGITRTSGNPAQATNFFSRVGCNNQQGGYMTEYMSFVNGIREESAKRMVTHQHKQYSASKVVKYVGFVKKKKTDLDKYRREKIAGGKHSELAKDTCKDGNLSESLRPYQCGFCEYKAARKDTLLNHFKTQHDDNYGWYKCQFCNYRTNLKDKLRSHSMSEHNPSPELYQCNQTVYDDHKEYSASEVMEYVSNIKEEKVDDLEDVTIDIEENNLNYKWLEVEKTEDVKYMITATDVSSSGVGCDGENSGQATSRLDVFRNQTGCGDHKEYSASEVTEYASNIKEEKVDDFEDVENDTKENNLNNKWIEVEKTAVDVSSSRVGCDGENSGQASSRLDVFHNQAGCGDHREYSASEVIEYVSNIKEERVDYLEDVKNDTKENNLNYKWIQVEKTEDVKCMITAVDVSSSRVGCDGENSGQASSRLDVFHNQAGCGDHKEYSASEAIEYVNNIKEEKTYVEDVAIDIDGKDRAEKTADSKYSELAVDICKDGDLSKSVWPYQCKFCEYIAKTRHNLLRHFKVKHDHNPEWHECQFCEYRTKLKSRLRSHFMSKHNTSAELYQCEICEFKTKSKRNLKRHFTVKHDIKHFRKKHSLDAEWLLCRRCTYKTNNKNTLACHYISKHPSTEDWYQCQLCEYGTYFKFDFKKHFKDKHHQGAEHHHCVIFVSLNKK